MVWGITATQPAIYKTVADFERATGQGPGNGDTTATTVPVALPSDVAALIGQPTGTKTSSAHSTRRKARMRRITPHPFRGTGRFHHR